MERFRPGQPGLSPDGRKTALSSPPLYNYEQFEGEDLAHRYRVGQRLQRTLRPKQHSLPGSSDELVNVYYDVVSEYGPGYNPLWYRVWRGYIHSGHLQKVNVQLNPVLSSIPESGQLAEVTVPVTQSLRYTSYSGWESLYRLYYQSVHWIIAVEEGPDGEAWYKLEDELDRHYVYYVPASHLRPVTAQELEPISPDVPFEKKRIEVSIAQQTLTAYENRPGGDAHQNLLWDAASHAPTRPDLDRYAAGRVQRSKQNAFQAHGGWQPDRRFERLRTARRALGLLL